MVQTSPKLRKPPLILDRFHAAQVALRYRGIIARTLWRDWHASKTVVRQSPPDLAELRIWCSFLSTPRSGHSLIGALLDAHPDAVIGSEYGILDHVIWGFSRTQIAALLLHDAKRIPHNYSRRFGTARTGGYRYDVAGQWQGRVRQLQILGDKNGSADTIRFARRPDLVKRIERRMSADLRFIHIYRNPFDVVSTIVRRSAGHSDGVVSLRRAIEMVKTRSRAHAAMIAQYGSEKVLSLAHEDHIADPQRELGAMVTWLGLDAPPDYLDACAALCFAAPRRTRGNLGWDMEDIDALRRLIEEIPFLQRYANDAPTR